MSNSSPNWSLEYASNPLNIQQRMMERFEEFADGDFIADPNNVVSFSMEMFAELTADATSEMDKSLQSIYPSRSQNTSDLYKHMSDYDYVHLFSSPASATLKISLDKTYLMRNARDYGTYKKVVIPKSTMITIGAHTFGLYYPVEIRINTASETFSVVYDTRIANPLYPIQNNVLEHSFRQYDNLKLLFIQLPVWQFKTTVHREELIAGTGFIKSLVYDDNFYAIRCFAETYETDSDTGVKTWAERELSLSLSNQSYDHTKPTAVFTIVPESNTCKVHIPYVYFSEGTIRGTLRIEMYTTAGALNYTIPTNTTEYCHLGFFTDDITEEESYYAEPLRTIPAIAAVPLNTMIKGGTNGMTYEELRDRVITDTFSDKPLQTPDDIDAYWKKIKYITTLYRDGVTDRVFISHAKLTDSTNAVIGSASISTQINIGNIDAYDTIHKNESAADTYTILPSTIYRFDATSGTCIPLTSDEVMKLDSLSSSDKVDAYNSNNYTISPFHLQICTKGKYPTTITYDLRNVEVESREFIGENPSTSSQLTLYSARFGHDLDESRYEMDMVVSRTDDLKDIEAVVETTNSNGATIVSAENFIVVVCATTIYGKQAFAKASFLSRESDLDIFSLRLKTKYELYQIATQHGIGINDTFYDADGDGNHVFALNTEFRVLLCAKRSIISESEYLTTSIETSLPNEYSDYLVLSEQKTVVKFGEVVNELDQRMALSYDKATYSTYNTTKFIELQQPIYRRDNNGAIVYTINQDGSVELDELYPAGTIAMITEEIDKQVTLTVGNISLYYGNTFTYVNANEVVEEVILTASNASEYVNKTGYIKASRTPRFNITGAFSETMIDAGIIGPYDIVDPYHMNSVSSSTDIWKMNKYVVDTGGTPAYDDYQVRAVDSLLVALKLATVVKHRSNLPAIGREGTFVFVEDDGVLIGGSESKEFSTPKYGFVSTGSADIACIGRLYMWAGSSWVSMIGVLTIADARAAIVCINEGKQEDGTFKPAFYGYTYVIEIINDHTKETPNRIDNSDLLGDLLYVSWLSQATIPGMDNSVTLYPSFTQVSGTYWNDHVNMWPWDVPIWNRLKMIILDNKDANGAATTIIVKQVLKDDIFGMSFDAQGSSKYCQYISGQLKLDENGKPQEAKSKEIVYLIDMVQLDAKLTIATTTNYEDYPNEVCEQMRAYFDDIGEAKPKLFPNSRIFFEPLRSFGYGTFTVSGAEKELPLDITMGFRLYVDKAASEDLNLIETLKEQIIKIIDEKISEGSVNCSEIAKEIKLSISDSVQHVDVLGINGDQNLQTMLCTDTNVRPHLKHVLKLLDDGATIDVERGLTIELVVTD